MTQGPSLTEWFDEEYYPGPERDDNIYFHVDLARAFGKNLIVVGTSVYKALVEAFGSTVEDILVTVSRSADSIAELGKSLGVIDTPDQDQPAGIHIRRNHGPYVGSGYDRRGRKRY